jgi:hypothetical protein
VAVAVLVLLVVMAHLVDILISLVALAAQVFALPLLDKEFFTLVAVVVESTLIVQAPCPLKHLVAGVRVDVIAPVLRQLPTQVEAVVEQGAIIQMRVALGVLAL